MLQNSVKYLSGWTMRALHTVKQELFDPYRFMKFFQMIPIKLEFFTDIWVKVVAAESVISWVLSWTSATAHCPVKGKKNNIHRLKELKIFKAHSAFSKENQLYISIASQSCTIKRLQRSLKQTALQTYRIRLIHRGTLKAVLGHLLD